jgi:hypothetical protein
MANTLINELKKRIDNPTKTNAFVLDLLKIIRYKEKEKINNPKNINFNSVN